MAKGSPFSTVAFAGGGSRCLWQVGFWSIASSELNIKPSVVAGVSAGASMACVIFAGTAESTLEYFKGMTLRNRRNFYITHPLRGKPAFPHYEMYRSGILYGLDGKAMKTLRRGPEIRIMISRIPSRLGPRSATMIGILAYSVEKRVLQPLHPVWGQKLGFRPEWAVANKCASAGELADLIIASSCTPPFTPIQAWKGAPALDGGFVDNIPVQALPEKPGPTLVLLTRRYHEKSIPEWGERVYVQPSTEVPVSKWDYTNPEGLQAAYDLGRSDAEDFIRRYSARASGSESHRR